jgi:hypothetical protein
MPAYISSPLATPLTQETPNAGNPLPAFDDKRRFANFAD